MATPREPRPRRLGATELLSLHVGTAEAGLTSGWSRKLCGTRLRGQNWAHRKGHREAGAGSQGRRRAPPSWEMLRLRQGGVSGGALEGLGGGDF